jgi:hypothetical protein
MLKKDRRRSRPRRLNRKSGPRKSMRRSATWTKPGAIWKRPRMTSAATV